MAHGRGRAAWSEFFRNPSRYLLRRRLGVELRRDADQLQDDEPLVADGAGQRALAERLLPALLAVADRARAAWPRPARTAGRRAGPAAAAAGADGAGKLLPRVCAPPPSSRRSTLAWPSGRSRSTVNRGRCITLAGLRREGLLRWRCADPDARDRLEAWIHHLALCLAAPPGVARQTQWLARHETLRFAPVADAQAPLATCWRCTAAAWPSRCPSRAAPGRWSTAATTWPGPPRPGRRANAAGPEAPTPPTG
ncbi:MAG: hypothetical protein IPM99_19105 [Rubrivivax sp.]|nr:hypothetical protein [Rubrivivax sp.]